MPLGVTARGVLLGRAVESLESYCRHAEIAMKGRGFEMFAKALPVKPAREKAFRPESEGAQAAGGCQRIIGGSRFEGPRAAAATGNAAMVRAATRKAGAISRIRRPPHEDSRARRLVSLPGVGPVRQAPDGWKTRMASAPPEMLRLMQVHHSAGSD